MAPPSTDLPLKERLIALAQTLQFAWFAGHVLMIASTIRYSLSLVRFNMYGGMARFSYRLSFIAAAATYGIVVYKSWRSRVKAGTKPPGGAIGYLADENVQYLAMALVWLFSPQYPLAVLPYCIYSVFHTLVYTRQNLIPTVQPTRPAVAGEKAPPHAAAELIGNFVKKYYEASMSVVSSLELLLWLRLLLAAVFFARRSWILFGIYTIFLRTRFAQSAHVQNSFSTLETRVDSLVASQSTPPAARQVWDSIKGGARQFHAATDVNQYLSGAAAPKKTS
jgi:hypothetical protein